VCIYYGSENFGLGPLHDDYVGLVNAKFNVLIVVEFISEIKNKRQLTSPSLQSRQIALFILVPALKKLIFFSVRPNNLCPNFLTIE